MEINFEIFELDRFKDELSLTEIEYLDTLSNSEIESYINFCNNQYNYFNALQTGLKLILNSIYGAFGNDTFVCSTKDIAGAITAMGRDVVKYMDNVNEKYWYEFWHLDTELHEHLGITGEVKKLDPAWIHRLSKNLQEDESVITQLSMEIGEYQRRTPVSDYVDTDSLFVGFEPGMKSCNWTGNEQDFVMKISKFRLEKLFITKLNGYTKKYNVKNIQEFELENINESILFVTKKNYIKHVVWEDGRQYDRLTNITPKGVPLIKQGTPHFGRTKVMDIIKYIFDNSKTYNIKDLLKKVRELKKEFEMTSVDEIAPSANLNNYWSEKIFVDGKTIDSPGIVSDNPELVMAKGCYYTIKAAGLYNHLLYKHPELINDYEILRPGTKVRMYPCIHELNDKFCYVLGKNPVEFSPPVDYDELFQKTVADQVNYYLNALDLPSLNKRLKIVLSLF